MCPPKKDINLFNCKFFCQVSAFDVLFYIWNGLFMYDHVLKCYGGGIKLGEHEGGGQACGR